MIIPANRPNAVQAAKEFRATAECARRMSAYERRAAARGVEHGGLWTARVPGMARGSGRRDAVDGATRAEGSSLSAVTPGLGNV